MGERSKCAALQSMIDIEGVNSKEENDDAEESNVNLSNDEEAKAEVVIASSPAFS